MYKMYEKYKVVEKFSSINGEARRAGELAVFIRFAGCNLRCSYCDTLYAITDDAKYKEESLEDIINYVESSHITNVTLTGGEPLLQEGIADLVAELLSRNHRVEIETNGAVSILPMYRLAKELRLNDELSITLDYKCPSSGMESFMLMENYELLRPCDTVKFVVGSREDLDKARKIIERFSLTEKCPVYLSAVFGAISNAEIVDYMMEHNMNKVIHQLQQHKFIWHPDARGV
ncbi:MAG: putative 7-carboxy-7-deazaguanine synthase QueE [Eubacterium sp.]|nr:putative 7-carboxy-7-deazaguanine synthase QueE [Eubacterium sp.]